MQKPLYTIGYSSFGINDFIAYLRRQVINVLIDVRSNPYSSHFSEYNKERLAKVLGANGIHYRNYAKEFGAQQTNREFYTPQGYLDFKMFTDSELFGEGYRRIEDSVKREYSVVFMCAEKDPIDCHRSIMITKAFTDNGYEVLHLLPDNKHASQSDIEERLLNKYYPDRDQLSLFSDKGSSELISEAYRKRNADIGHYIAEG